MNHERKSHPDNPPIESPVSTRVEKKQVEERLAIGPQVVYETIRLEGEQEPGRKPTALAWSALARNVIGGSLVAALNHAQVVGGKEEP